MPGIGPFGPMEVCVLVILFTTVMLWARHRIRKDSES